jgi:K+-dependent Na+/Ca+ exchanger-like protein|eukprot:TRINITY_DN61079_c0_g1_i1.p1 TRINITY_DN61079_c0_g1~~TRINITY_DN61079_c0_g1_i1.p1  ORF type:complete len:524 (-),score=81.27 TRINITY_DN61079_c0_g1_i1:237-1808(-)
MRSTFLLVELLGLVLQVDSDTSSRAVSGGVDGGGGGVMDSSGASGSIFAGPPSSWIADAIELSLRDSAEVWIGNGVSDSDVSTSADSFPLFSMSEPEKIVFPPTEPLAYLWWFFIVYMFYVMAAVCDDYLVPAVDIICNRFHVPEDVAGATFMAFACNAPETLCNVGAIFVTHSSMGVGTIVGSAVFNVLVIIGSCPLVAPGGVMKIPAKTFLRDSFFSATSIFLVYWALPHIGYVRASVLFGMAFVYVFAVATSKYWLGTQDAAQSEKELAKLEEKLISETGDSELVRERKESGCLFDEVKTVDAHLVLQKRRSKTFAEDNAQIMEVRKETNSVSSVLLVAAWCSFIMTSPTDVVLRFTVPDVKVAEKEKWFAVTFIVSMFWLGATSLVCVLGSDALQKYWGIPQSFLGLTLVSIGTSFPNLWASVVTARQGRGPIAASNALGSNVQNVFLVLAGPIWGRVMQKGSYEMGGDDIMTSIIWMGLALSIVVVTVVISGFTLGRSAGFCFIFVYIVYVVQTTLSE